MLVTMDELAVRMGERVKAARKKAGLSQAELAEAIEVSLRGVQQWESGERRCSLENLQRLAQTLHTSMAYLLGETDSPRPIHELIRPADQGSTLTETEPPPWEELLERQRAVEEEVRELRLVLLSGGRASEVGTQETESRSAPSAPPSQPDEGESPRPHATGRPSPFDALRDFRNLRAQHGGPKAAEIVLSGEPRTQDADGALEQQEARTRSRAPRKRRTAG